MRDPLDDDSAAVLPAAVAERLRSELNAADAILRCLRTAARLIALAESDPGNLRLAESAAYNVRQALDLVVARQDPAQSGLRAVLAVWHRFEVQVALPDADVATARGELERVLRTVAADSSRVSRYAAQLLGYLRHRSGTDPHRRQGDFTGAVLDLVAALANTNADLAAALDDAWNLALAATRDHPSNDAESEELVDDPLTQAINCTWGRGLLTTLALAAWEFRNRGTVRVEFDTMLDGITTLTGPTALGFRAVLALHRPLLETIAREWLDGHAAMLFREGSLARDTFELTVKLARPTAWFYQEFGLELRKAARRGADRAMATLLVALLNEVEGYRFDTVIQPLLGNHVALASAAEEIAILARSLEADSSQLDIAVRCWEGILDQTGVPAAALVGFGEWSMVSAIPDDQWLPQASRTLDLTNGRIDDASSVADRAAAAPSGDDSRNILLRLLDNNEPWERHHAALKAINVLRESIDDFSTDSFQRLRTRLIDLGQHQARDIVAPDANG